MTGIFIQHELKAFWRSKNTGKSITIKVVMFILVGIVFLYVLAAGFFWINYWLACSRTMICWFPWRCYTHLLFVRFINAPATAGAAHPARAALFTITHKA